MNSSDIIATDIISIETLLSNPKIETAIVDINTDTLDRRTFVPQICKIFYDFISPNIIINGNITTGDITTGNITTGNITTGNITTGDITTGDIATGDITTGNIITGEISSDRKISSNKFISLEDQPNYRFAINREAEKQLPDIIYNHVQKLVHGAEDNEVSKSYFFKKRNIGIVFSGGPAPGGHNVVAGIFDATKKANPESKIFGFILGPEGILENRYVEITAELVDTYRNMGGFTMIKTGRTKIDSKQKMDLSKVTCKELNLDALVIVGGDDSNTNAAFLAQELKADGIQVIGIPKTIDGDIQIRTEDGDTLCAISFGFHSAARAFAQNISNLCTDASSDLKYWHVCKVMGRVASHLALEVALQTHANLTLIGEDLADYVDNERLKKAKERGEVDYTAYGMTLRHLSRLICDAIVKRAAKGKNYGVLVIPEGVLEFINEIQIFIIKLNTIIAQYNQIHDLDFHTTFHSLDAKLEYLRRLSRGITEKQASPIWNARDDELFNDLPSFFQEGLLVERDTHGNFQFSQVNTEKIIMDMVGDYLHILKEKGEYKVGIEDKRFHYMMERANLNAELFGKTIFRNYEDNREQVREEDKEQDKGDDVIYYLIRKKIISVKTLKQALVGAGIITEDEKVPNPVLEIFKKSVPNFKTQIHFYGYDGRGSHPTKFDCNYTYNLGLTAFCLIANGATGQMAVIKNLEHHLETWEPLGVPIAKLMHLEERSGKLALVIEKNVVDTNANSFRILKAMREKWLAAEHGEDHYRKPGPVRFQGKSEEDKPLTLVLNSIYR